GGLLAMVVGTAATLAGFGLALALYKGKAEDRLPELLGPAYDLAARNFGVDALYDRLVVRPFAGLTRFVRSFDFETLDALFVGVPKKLAEVGALAVSKLQTGVLHMH